MSSENAPKPPPPPKPKFKMAPPPSGLPTPGNLPKPPPPPAVSQMGMLPKPVAGGMKPPPVADAGVANESISAEQTAPQVNLPKPPTPGVMTPPPGMPKPGGLPPKPAGGLPPKPNFGPKPVIPGAPKPTGFPKPVTQPTPSSPATADDGSVDDLDQPKPTTTQPKPALSPAGGTQTKVTLGAPKGLKPGGTPPKPAGGLAPSAVAPKTAKPDFTASNDASAKPSMLSLVIDVIAGTTAMAAGILAFLS